MRRALALGVAVVLLGVPLAGEATAVVAASASTRVLLEDAQGRWWSEPITGGQPVLTSLKGTGLLSPNGAWFVSASNADGQPRIAVTRSDGSERRVLLDAANPPVTILRWSADSSKVLAALSPSDGSYPLVWITIADGATTLLHEQAAQDMAPDLRLGAWAGDGDREIYFGDQKAGTDAGSVRDPINTGFTDPDDQVNGGLTWSPSGRRVLVYTTQDARQDGIDYSYTTLSLLDLGRRSISSYAGGSDVTAQFSPDGSAVCWDDTDTIPDGNGNQTFHYDRAYCATSSLKTKVRLTFPTGDIAISGINVIGPSARLDSEHGKVSALAASTRPSAIEVKETVTGGDGAGQLVVLSRGTRPPASPQRGRRVTLTEGGHVVFSHLPPRTTFTVTVFPRSWRGTLGPARSTTITTPNLVASLTALTLTKHTPQIATVTVRRADNGRPLAGAKVTLYGQILPPDEDPSYAAATEPFHAFAHITTNADGVAHATVPKTVSNIKATTARATGWSASTSATNYTY